MAATQRVKPISVGILGLGLAGRFAARALPESKYTRLAAVCDLSPETSSAIAEVSGAKSYTDIEQLVSDDEIEAIYIATPTHLRVPHVAIASKAGKHLLVEKPIARNLKEAQEIVSLAADNGITLMSVNTRGGDPQVRMMARLIREGQLGEFLSLTNVMYKPWVLAPRFDYELDPELGGGVNFRQAPHQIEIARAIAGKPATAVTATVGYVDAPVASYGNFNAFVEFEGGSTASLIFNGYGYFDTSELTFGMGEGGGKRQPGAGIKLRQERSWERVKYSGGPRIGPQRTGLSIYGVTIVSCEYGDLRPSRTGVTVYDNDSVHNVRVSRKDGGLPVDFAEFYEAVRFGKPLLHDAMWGAKTVELCEAIWVSAQEHRAVRF